MIKRLVNPRLWLTVSVAIIVVVTLAQVITSSFGAKGLLSLSDDLALKHVRPRQRHVYVPEFLIGEQKPHDTQLGRLAEGLQSFVKSAGKSSLIDSAGVNDVQPKRGIKSSDGQVLLPAPPNNAKQDMVIGVVLDPESIWTLGVAAMKTWVPLAEMYYKVYFFVGSCEPNFQGFAGDVICLDTPDVYPPQLKVFLLWQYMWLHFRDKYTYFMKMDADAYMNVPRMVRLLDSIKLESDRFLHVYVGNQATGRPEERVKLGLDGKKYCLGMGYLVDRSILAALGDNALSCSQNVMSAHSDTEVFRCIRRIFPEAECQKIHGFSFKQIYYQQQGSRVFPMTLESTGQMKLLFPKQPKAAHFGGVLLHPLKTQDAFLSFHKQVVSYLRPTQPSVSFSMSPHKVAKVAVRELKLSCVNNPVRQLQHFRFALPECASPKADIHETVPSKAFVVSYSDTEKAIQTETELVLRGYGIETEHVRVPAPASSNLAWALALAAIFRNNTLSTGIQEHAFILDVDILFRCQFRQRLLRLLQSQRCSGHLFTDMMGGVVLLGAQPPLADIADFIEADRTRAVERGVGLEDAALCYNYPQTVQTGLSGLYHRAAFQEILAFAQDALSHKSSETPELSDLLTHLSDLGYIVRASHPSLVLARSSFSSRNGQVDARQAAVDLRWTQGSFCDSQDVSKHRA